MKTIRKGFTLIELLAVFVIIGLITTISIKFIIEMSDRAKEKSYMEYENVIKSAAHSYIIDNSDVLNKVKSASCSKPITISLSTLTQKKYLSEKDLKNPKTNKDINISSSYIKVYYGYRFAEFENDGITCNNQDGQDYDYRYYVNIVDKN